MKDARRKAEKMVQQNHEAESGRDYDESVRRKAYSVATMAMRWRQSSVHRLVDLSAAVAVNRADASPMC